MPTKRLSPNIGRTIGRFDRSRQFTFCESLCPFIVHDIAKANLEVLVTERRLMSGESMTT
ncbi:MAG: hypothetical protein KDA81_20390 [Planctomycetaceae bacterium]|nr:hypothetical protein [Planctomycetaceae bacterium]